MTTTKHLTIPEAARSVGVSVWTVKQWIGKKLIKPVPLPTTGRGVRRHLRIPQDDWDRFVASWRNEQKGV